MPRTNLSLGNLYRAISGSVRVAQAVSLGGLGGVGAGSNAAFTSFAVDSVAVNLPLYTYIVESTAESASFTFGTQGSLHVTKVSPQTNNYTCSFSNANFTIGSPTYGATANFPFTAASVGTTTYAEAQSVITMQYADGYNLAATGYGVPSTKILYAVDVYNTVNQPDFCLLFGTKITLADNTEINIEDLNVGDVIKAWAPIGLPDETLDATDTGATEWRFYQTENNNGEYIEVVVRNVTFNFASSYYSINNGFLKATETHPIWVWDNEIQKYHFKIVETLKNGDRLIYFDETTGLREIEITNIEVIVSDVEIVTVDVENSDVFLANGTISHNKGSNVSSIPATGLKMYIEPAKSGSFAANAYPATGTPTVDILDLTGNGTGLRPGLQSPLSLAGGSPSYNQGATRKERYYSFDGGDLFYKDTASNINGGIANFNTNTGTIHVWVRPTTTLGTTTRHIFDYAGFYGLAIESSNSSTLDRVKFYGSTLGNSAQLTTSLSANVWYMISATFQPSGTVTVYVDGTSVGTFTAAAFSNPVSTNYVTVGSNSARTTFWNGQIGPVLFYNVLQSGAEVTRTYNYFSPNYK